MKFTAKSLLKFVCSDPNLRKVHLKYPFRVSDHIAGLINAPDDPIGRQFIPTILELENDGGLDDPLGENDLSPTPNLVHRYPDRVLWLLTSRCAARCRFCTRKRLWKYRITLSEKTISDVRNYIEKHKEIRDVLISGGDPLLLNEEDLERALHSIRSIEHVVIIRVGTRLPISDPGRIPLEKISLLARYQPLYVNIHVNHPRELSDPSVEIIENMASAGIPLGSQTVLLRHINDSPEILHELFLLLLKHRVRPYYLLQMDLMKGTAHFRTPLSRGLEIIKSLRHRLSGLAIPHFVVDLPGGGGKIPLVPSYVERFSDNGIFLRNRHGTISFYPIEPGEEQLLKNLLSNTFP